MPISKNLLPAPGLSKQQIDALESQIAKLKAKEKAIADSVWPKENDGVWVFTGKPEHFIFLSPVPWMLQVSLAGNFFRTEAECQAHHDALCVVEELRRTPGRRPFIAGEENYALSIDVESRVGAASWNNVDRGWQSLYWESKAERDAAIVTVGESRILAAAKFFRERA